jgi:tripartite-type tricarboxylate transporter receptor subunit TctC
MTSGEPLIEKARSYRTTIGLYVTVVALAVALPLHAQTSKNFYEGKTITFLVGSSAGGGTDLTARVIARHIERYIPGKPRTTSPTSRARAA